MNLKTVVGLAALTVACTGAARAAPATPEEAQRLTGVFERYLGHAAAGQPSAVTVTPDGETYKAAVDIGRLLAPLKALGINVTKPATFALVLTPQADGTWHVVVDGVPQVDMEKDAQMFSMALRDYRLDGLFDPKLGDFRTSTSHSGGTSMQSSGPQGTNDTQYTIDGQTAFTGEDVGDGTVNANSQQTVKSFTYSLDVKGPPDATDEKRVALSVDAKGGPVSASFVGKNERMTSLLDLWAFMVAHPSKEAMVASQSDLKARLKAMVPFVTALSGDLKGADIIVNTPQGRFGAAAFAEHYELNGTLKDGVSTTIRMTGFTMPAGLVPGWAAGLVPSGIDITQGYGPLKLTPALLTAIDDFDLGADKPLTDEQSTAIVQSLMPTGDTVVSLAPSTITTPLMTMKVEGEMRLAKPMPTGTATISLTGLDKAIDEIRGAAPNDQTAAQAIAMLSAVKVLAKAEGADSYSWHVEALPGRDITVNGTPLSQATPAVPVAPAAPAPRPPKKKKPNAFQ